MFSKKRSVLLVFLLALFLISVSARAATFTAAANGNWNSRATWGTGSGTGTVPGTDFPGASDVVIIPNTRSVTVNITNAVCSSLTFNSGGANGYTMMSFSSATSQLTVSGAITIGEITNNSRTKTLNIGAGILIAGSVSMTNSTADSRDTQISISTGTFTVNGNMTMNGSELRHYITFTGAGVMNIGGQFMPTTASASNGGGINPSTTSVINFNGTAAQQTFPNSVAKLGSNNYDIDVNSTFVTGANNDGNDGLELTAAVTFDALEIGNVNAAALFDASTFATFSGNVVMTGASSKMIIRTASLTAFNAGDVFNTGSTVEYASNSAQTINMGTGSIPFYHLVLSGSGTKSISRSSNGTFAVSGNLTYNQTNTTSYTNVNAIDLAGNFEGTASISSGSTAVNIAGNWTNTATGTITGTVTYDGAGSQIVNGDLTYTNLVFSGSGTNTITRTTNGTFAVTGNWTLGVQPAYSNVNLIDIGGDMEGSSFINSGTIPIDIDGDWNNTGAGIITGLVTYNSASAQNVSANIRYDGGLTFSGAGAKAIIRAASGAFDVRGVFTQNSPIASYHANISFLDFDGDYNGNQFINSGNLLIYMLRDWNNTANGTLTGLVRYDKIGGTQVVSGNVQYHDLTLEAGGTKIVDAAEVKVTGTVTITGNTTFNTNNNLTLVQTATTMASIATIPAGSSITGDVNVQVYITGGADARGTRMMSSPINDAALTDKTYKQLKNYVLITHPGNLSGFDTRGTSTNGLATIVTYNEPASTAAASFPNISDINTSSPPGNGFYLFFRGDRSTNTTQKLDGPTFPAPESVTAVFTGPVNTGTFVKNLSYTNNSQTSDGYNALGNPYPSVLDWDLVTKTPGVSDVITVVRRNGSFSATYDRGTGTSTNGGSRYLQPAQGFYVKVNAAGQSVTFQETHKVSTAPAQRLLSVPVTDRVLGGGNPAEPIMGGPVTNNAPAFKRLKFQAEKNRNIDETAILFLSGSVANATLEDGYYFSSDTVKLATLSANGVSLAINKLPPVTRRDSVKLEIVNTLGGATKLRFTEFLGLENYKISLIDNFTGTVTDIQANTVYEFTVTGSNTSTFGKERLLLVFEAPSVDLSSFTAEQSGQTAKLDWITSSEYQSIKYEVERSADGVNFTKIGQVNGAGTTSHASNYTFTDQNPVSGTNYYRFRQYDVSNRVMTSPVLQLNFTPPAAMVLSSFTAVKQDDAVKLDWTTSSEFQSQKFEVERSADGIGFTKIGELAGAGTSTQTTGYAFTDTSPEYGSNFYRLKHYSTGGQTLLSQVIKVDIPIPPAIVLDSFTGEKSGQTARLNWVTSTEYQSQKFEVERSADGASFTVIGEVSGAGNSRQLNNYAFIDQAPQLGLNYYRLKHYTIQGATWTSATISLNFSTPAGSILASFAGRNENRKAVLNWKTGTLNEQVSFEIERSTDGGASFFQIGLVSSADSGSAPPDFEFTDENPEYTVNYYRLRYYTPSGTEGLSSVIQLKFDPPPAMVLSSFTALKQGNEAHLSWATSSEYRSLRFEVQHSTDGVNFVTLNALAGAGTTEQPSVYGYVHTRPEYGLNYYRLVHYNLDNQQLTGNVVSLNFPPPPAMVLLSFSGKKVNGVSELNWVTSSEYQSLRFEVERSADGVTYLPVGSVNGSGTVTQQRIYSYVDRAPRFGMNYYRLKHYDTKGQTLLSHDVQLQYDAPANVVIQEVKIYPNPVTETIYAIFDNPSGGNLVVSIIDVQSGKKISSETIAPAVTASQDVKNLRQGIYLLEIREALSGRALVREKFIKN